MLDLSIPWTIVTHYMGSKRQKIDYQRRWIKLSSMIHLGWGNSKPLKKQNLEEAVLAGRAVRKANLNFIMHEGASGGGDGEDNPEGTRASRSPYPKHFAAISKLQTELNEQIKNARNAKKKLLNWLFDK